MLDVRFAFPIFAFWKLPGQAAQQCVRGHEHVRKLPK